MKKTTWIRIAAVLVTIIPPIVVLCINFPIIATRPDKMISVAAILVAIICIYAFKDAAKRFYQTPTAFKTLLFCFLLSLIAITLGEQLLVISATGLVSSLCAMPLNLWYNSLVLPPTKDEVVNGLKEIIKEIKGDENSHKDN